MINIPQKENEDRKTYLVRLAVAFIESHSGFVGVDDELFYDGAESDSSVLADDLREEFDL